MSPHNLSRRDRVIRESERLRKQSRGLRKKSEARIKRAKKVVAEAKERTETLTDMLAQRKRRC